MHNPWRQYDAQANKEAYDLSQMQRKKERDIRDSEKKIQAYDEAIANCADPETVNVLKEARADEAAKLRSRNKAYGEFCDENGLKRQAFRLQVAKSRQQEAKRAYYSQPHTITIQSPNAGTILTKSDAPLQSKDDGVIIDPSRETGDTDVAKIAEIQLDKYKPISENVTTSNVVITNERISHISERHPGDWETYGAFAESTVTDPDFILRDKNPDTAICIKQIEVDGEIKHLRTTLRLHTSNDESGKENSILTFQKINKKEYGRLSRNEKVVYRKE